MSAFWDWIIEIPSHLAAFGSWLTTDIAIGSLTLTPLAMVGVGAVSFIGIILTLRIVHLVSPFG